MADDTTFETKLAAAYEKAPPVVREYIASGDLEKFLGRIRGQYRFSSPEMATIGTEILMALLGISTLADVKIGIKVGTNIPIRVRDDLLEDIKVAVFEPILKKLPASAPAPKGKTVATPSVPPKPVPSPAPINRLTPPASPKLLPKKEEAKSSVVPVVASSKPPAAASTKATPPLMPKAAPAQVMKSVAPPTQKPVAPAAAPKSAPIFPSVAASVPKPSPVSAAVAATPAKPPLVAPVPQPVAPQAPSAPVPPKSTESAKRVDPYREPIE